jgi:hypothetical protein
MSRVITDICTERQKQIDAGYGASHDDLYENDELAYNAIDIVHSTLQGAYILNYEDDFGVVEKHADDPRQRLIIAIALLVAHAEAMDRKSEKPIAD